MNTVQRLLDSTNLGKFLNLTILTLLFDLMIFNAGTYLNWKASTGKLQSNLAI